MSVVHNFYWNKDIGNTFSTDMPLALLCAKCKDIVKSDIKYREFSLNKISWTANYVSKNGASSSALFFEAL